MTEKIIFQLDGIDVEAIAGESIWQTAQRLGTSIPHLCYSDAKEYRSDGNCRACLVEIEGERVLAASCIRQPSNGMKVNSANARARNARNMVVEMLIADQPDRNESPDPNSKFWQWAEAMEVTTSRLPAGIQQDPDDSHPGISVNLNACIQCGLCVRACREVQVNDVIAMSGRGANTEIVFDFGDDMGASSCVGCGECVQACPTGALLSSENLVARTPDREVKSVCPYCGVGCQLTYRIKDDRITEVIGNEGPANAGKLCVKGRYGFDYVHNPERLTKPLIRKDGISKSDVNIDPANPLTHFREASWEEALAVASGGLTVIRDRDGGNALAGFGSAKGSNEEAYLFQKLVRSGFGTNNVDHCTRLCHASSVAALMETIGSGAVTAPFTDALLSDVIVVIGCNPTVNHPVAATFIKQSVKRGAKLIVIDPRGQALSRHATWILQEKGGADVSLLNAMMHVIVEEDLTDKQYIQAQTEGFEELREHLRDFSPEKMTEICGVPAADIRAAARLYASAERAIIFWGMGMSQHIHGTDNCRSLISLALMTGQVGRPGTGLHPLRGQNNVQGASDAGLIPMMLPDYGAVADPEIREKFEAAWDTSLDPNPGLTVVEITDAVHQGKIKGLYVMGENPAMSDPNVSHARAGLTKLEHLVVQDIFLTETACFADVVLPASAWPEKDGTVTNTNRQVQIGRKALPLPGDARLDIEIIQDMAHGLGLDWDYAGPQDVFDEMRGVMPSIAGITWERLEAENAVTYPCRNEDDPGEAVIFGDGFPTPSGRGKFVPTSIIEPDEMPDREYPMILTTGRVLEHWHTGAMTRRSHILDHIEPEPTVHMAPGDLEQYGVQAGDNIHVVSRRGEISLKARADAGVQSGMIFIPFCYAEAAANLLTNDALDPYGKIAETKFCAVRIEAA